MMGKGLGDTGRRLPYGTCPAAGFWVLGLAGVGYYWATSGACVARLGGERI